MSDIITRQRSFSNRQLSPTRGSPVSRQRSTSGQSVDSISYARQAPPRPPRRDHDFLLPEEYQSWPHNDNDFLSVEGSLDGGSLPTRKKSSNHLIRIARQASDSAFRSVRLNKKPSDSNLAGSCSGVYEQNPKTYIYLEQQQQQNAKTEPPRQLYLHQSSQNSQISLSPSVTSQRHLPLAPPRPLKTELRRNISMPDLKASFDADKNNTTVTRGTSLPLRQRVYPYHFIPQETDEHSQNSRRQYDNNDWSTPLRHCSVKKRSGLSQTTTHAPTLTMISAPVHVPSIDATLNHNSDGTTPSHPVRVASPPPSFNPNEILPSHHLEHLQHHQQQRTRRLARHRAFSQESLPGHIDTRLFAVPGLEKELPPTPPGSASPISPLLSQLSHVVPFSSGASLKRSDSVGIIPQDASRSMDQKTLQKVITQASVSSRVYKVMEQEQVDDLRKEQDEIQHFIEALNVSLHIETRMRDASHSLIRLHENNSNLSAVRAATAQLNTTTRKMDQIVQKIQHSMWRLLAIQKMLLQHEGAVLNVGMRRLDNENRELSRNVRHLEEAHGHEKEERVYWKNRHSKLKVQSILFQELPKNVTTNDNLALEKAKETEAYIKELQDEIARRAENEANLEKRLQAVCNWADDFSLAVDVRSPTKLTPTPKESSSSECLQERLQRLQTDVEGEFKRLITRVDDWKSIVEAAELTEEVMKNGRPSASSRYSLLDIANLHRLSLNSGSSESREDTVPREGSPLQMILDESLIELERQIFSERSTSSRPSSSTTSSTISFLNADDSDDTSDESAIADAHNEIRKLNAMVSELEHRARAIDR
ncbi:hypothetical protein BGZ59_002697 [Podila verticillata]|nr:hypothetical protein BGZ59_002697 [Podila verticillata]KFH65878.1 hypothetical protein MVEG_07981 [Podila verticillata NRRL 6337]